VTPTQLSLRHLRAEGWTAEVVERWNPHSRTRHDLFNLFDIVGVRDETTLGCQTTSSSNMAARVRKIADSEHVAAVREAGWQIVVHGWRKNKANRWELRSVDLS
jgi:hypothetical protein